ncbi:MAG TPA: DMSO reductase, partial [Saprospiraceae bacterium]|nr:DMSO reductase [Saprospiraceae bacterium]
FQSEQAHAQEAKKASSTNSILNGKREAIPSACWQCVSRCAIIAYVKNDRLLKIEGNPASLRNEGKVCAKGQAGVNQIYNPDRVLYPLKRIGERGSGKWEKISWEEAMDLLINGGEIEGKKVKGLRTLKEENRPEKFLFHYGRMVGSTHLIAIDYFLNAYGTASIGDHDSICSRSGKVAQKITGQTDFSFQLDEAEIVFNFGKSIFEAGSDHVPTARRFSKMLAKGTKLYTFDVRLSNTAAKSTQWIPVKPGTDLAVILAMCNTLLQQNIYNKEQFEEITNVRIDEELKDHLKNYTPAWAEEISGVPAQKIKALAIAYGNAKQGVCISQRGAFMHYNGVQTRRAIFMLDALAGNIGVQLRKTKMPKWAYPFDFPNNENTRMNLFTGNENQYAITGYGHGISHQIVNCIDRGQDQPEVYMLYGHNPVYSNGNCQNNIRVYKNTNKIPFLVAVDVALSETSELADLVLPDTSFLERWALEGKQTPDGTPEYFIRQPVVKPMGESRSFVNMLCEIAKVLKLDLGFSTAQEFVEASCNHTPGIKELGGFEYMKKHGVWQDNNAKASLVKREKMELKSEQLERAGFSAIPAWMPIPSHTKMKTDELILTSFKVNVQTHSRTQNCKWLTEIYHENPAWINTKTAQLRGIENGDWIKIQSEVGEMITKAKVTQAVHPEVIAISNHAGHWGAWGKYATNKKSFVFESESDIENKWWKEKGAHVNKIIPIVGDPISGAMCWFDTVVKVMKIE